MAKPGTVVPNNEPIGDAIPVDEVVSLLNLKGLALWDKLRRHRPFPTRMEITPREFAGLLRNIALIKVLDEGRDYEYRIAGDAHLEAQGFSVLGKRLSQIERAAPVYGAALRHVLDRVRESCMPLALRGRLQRGDPPEHVVQHESLFLPLGTTPPVVDHVLIVSAYERLEFPAPLSNGRARGSG